MLKSVQIPAGKWVTLESFWNAAGTAFFRFPLGAHVRVRIGADSFGVNQGEQSLDGTNYKKLSVGLLSLGFARIQIKLNAPAPTEVIYDVYGDGVVRMSPEFHF